MAWGKNQGAAFFPIFFLFLFFMTPVAFAVAPSVGSISATDPISLNVNSTKLITCNATITDEDGYTDISVVNATFWDPVATTESAADDNSNHYTNTSCSLSGGVGNTTNAVCSFSVQFYANPAEWTCKLYANDSTGNVASNSKTDVTVNPLKAMSVTSSLTFPEQALGSTTTNANEQSLTITNTGNMVINVSVYGYGASESDGYAMVCTVGGSEIPIGNLKYSLTASQDFSSMTALTSSSVTVADFNLAKGASSTKNIYWKIQIPNSDVGGSCSGNIIIDAV